MHIRSNMGERTLTGKKSLVAGILCLGMMLPVYGNDKQPVRECTLSIGHGVACVRELREVNLELGEQDIYITPLPRMLDPFSFQIRSLQADIDVRDWAWQSRDKREKENVAGLYRADEGHVWNPHVPPDARVSAASLNEQIRCRITSSVSGPQILEIIYLIPAIQWDMEYAVVIHGADADSSQKLSVDFKGYVVIENQSDGAFKHALLHVLSDGDIPDTVESAKGFLMLNEDSALSDLWQMQEAGVPEKNLYVLPQRVNVAPFSRSDVEYVSVSRIPARRVYSMSYSDIPITMEVRGKALREIIIFDNVVDRGRGLGRALPGGPVTLSKGGAYPQLLSGARIPHTSAGDEIRLDLGASPTVRGLRRELSRTLLKDGQIEIVYELQVLNESRMPIRVEIEEKPPLNLEWDVYRADTAYNMRENTLFLTEEVSAQTTHSIHYTVHVHQPEWR